jgi:undecaprenyl-diphosphatase
MLDQLVQLDTELFIFLNGLGSETWDQFWLFYTNKLNWIPFYAVLGYLMFKRLNTKMFVLTLVVIVLMISFTDQGTNLFKNVLVKRLRPCHVPDIMDVMRLVRLWCGGQHGFFSGHSSNSMAIAIFSSLLLRDKYKYLPYILVIWSLLMGYSRIYVGAHYPLDVLCGFIFGGLSGFGFYKLDKYLQSRFQLK